MLIVWALAAARYQTVPQLQWLLYGIKPVIIAIVLQALWKLGKKAAKDLPTTIAGVGSGGLLRWIERNFAAGVARIGDAGENWQRRGTITGAFCCRFQAL